MHGFPIVGGNHFDRVPRATVEKRAVRPLAYALLAADAKVRVNFDATERRVVFIGNPEHAGFDRAILDARWRTGAARAAIGCYGEDARPFLARRFSVALRHGPVLFYDVYHPAAPKQGLRFFANT